MAKPLTKCKKAGQRYTPSAQDRVEHRQRMDQGLEEITRRATVVDPTLPDYLTSECLVALDPRGN